MSKNQKRNVSITGTIGFSELKVTAPADYAAGVNAVKVAMEHATREMGLFRSLGTLLHMNQKDGFDCPGCAWPDPDSSFQTWGVLRERSESIGRRSHFEACGFCFF